MVPAPGQRKYTIVLADDVAALRRLVRLATEASGRFQVTGEASTGVEAIARAKELKPDLVLLDLSMPELDGLEALPRVLEASPNSHVVVLSGFNHVRMAPVAKRMGASAYLEKGLEPDLLVRALLDVLEPGAAKPDGASAPPQEPGVSFPIPSLVSSLPTHPVRPQPPAQEAGPLPSFRVLLAEADPGQADRLARLITASRAARFACSHAANLTAATVRIEAGEADVVVLDPRGLAPSPDEAFLEVLGRASAVPVVALAAAADRDVVGRGLRLGIEDCLDPAIDDPEALGRSLLYAIERRRSQDARRRLRDQEAELQHMRDMEALKTQFFNAAAHELGSPLTPIRLQVARLRELGANLDPAARRSLEILERNVERMARLNQDILDVARLQAGRLPIDKRPIEVKALVRDAVDTFEPVAREAGIGLTATCPEGIVVEADEQRLMQVLCNLVGNALKFTPRGGVVALDVNAAGPEVNVSVRDNGPGLTEEQVARLFQPFSQVLGDQQPHGVGAGLGLFICRGIVELHGGHIACRSAGPGHGSTFSFAVPRLPPAALPSAMRSVAVAAS